MPGANVSGEESARLSHSHAGRYAVIWIALVAFTFLTWALSRLHLGGGWGIVVALAIAITKSTLVALFFMHLWDQRGANRLVFVTALVFVSLLIGLRAGRGRYTPDYYVPVELAGLYWHLVDLIWIFVFPLIYLI